MRSALIGLFVALVLACTVLPATSATLHVWQESLNPTTPYTNWATAAHVIQDAVNAAGDGDTVLVTNGVYATGGRIVSGTMSNRVAVTMPITLKSVNGPEVTVITGYYNSEADQSGSPIRCIYLADGAILSGFTLANGGTHTQWWYWWEEKSGGGVCCLSTNAIIANCTLMANTAFFGGGVMYGTTMDCRFISNSAISGGGISHGVAYSCAFTGNQVSASGGGAFDSSLSNCMLIRNFAGQGGAAVYSTLRNSLIKDNASQDGGGVFESVLNNCLLTENTAARSGGGAINSYLNNCTVTGNTGGNGGGVWGSILWNCIIYFNSAYEDPNYDRDFSRLAYCCTSPAAAGSGNITKEPAFVDPVKGDFRLTRNSPCIDTGADLSHLISSDLDGNPRPLDGDGDGIAQFDMGAYEFRIETPSEELASLIVQVAQSDLSLNRKTPLLVSLHATQESLDRVNFRSAVNQLLAFEKKVLAQVARVDIVLAVQLIEAAENIIKLVGE